MWVGEGGGATAAPPLKREVRVGGGGGDGGSSSCNEEKLKFYLFLREQLDRVWQRRSALSLTVTDKK